MINTSYLKGQIAKKSTEQLLRCCDSYNTQTIKTEREKVYRELLKDELAERMSKGTVAI